MTEEIKSTRIFPERNPRLFHIFRKRAHNHKDVLSKLATILLQMILDTGISINKRNNIVIGNIKSVPNILFVSHNLAYQSKKFEETRGDPLLVIDDSVHIYVDAILKVDL